MLEKEIILELENAIQQNTTQKIWDNVDQLYTQLNKHLERTADSILQHAIAVENNKDLPRAATMLRKALRMEPENNAIKLQLGKIYYSQKRIPEAEEVLRDVVKSEPENSMAVRYLVQCIHSSHYEISSPGAPYSPEKITECVRLIEKVLAVSPNDAALWILLGSICGNDNDRFDEAERAFEKGIELAPGHPSATHNFGQFKRLRGDLEGSKALLNRACELDPKNADYAFSLALTYLFLENLERSMECLKNATEINPNHNAAHVYIAFILFFKGRFKEGWKQYEKRLKLDEFKGIHFGRPRWDGSKLGGEPILLLREQGIGDNIQFIRYAKQVAEKGARVIVFAWKDLETLFKSVPGVSIVTTGIPEPKHFYRYCSLMSLPYVLKSTKRSIPNEVPYMEAPEALVKKWRKKIYPISGLRVGLAWRGNAKHANDRFRSISLKDMSSLLEVENISFFSLMKERPEIEADLPENLFELGANFKDFSDTAAAMESLDLIVTVDTSICHLAGALGRPVWTMIAKGNDFRWGLRGKNTPWYPTMKLYRQKKLGSWSDVIKKIRTDLKREAK